jgi:hypothetical protein
VDIYLNLILGKGGACGGAVGWGAALQARRSRVRFFFHWHNPSGRTLALGLTQPLREIRTRNISWWLWWWWGRGVKAAGAYGWQPYPLYVPTVLKSGSLDLLEPSRLVQACNRDCFTPFFSFLFTFTRKRVFKSLI